MSHHRSSALLCTALIFALSGQSPAQPKDRLEFTRLVAHWAEYSDPGYLSFIGDAKPRKVIVVPGRLVNVVV